ncbi:MAG TPA: RNA methyltransferase, partial [Polyangiaceae bacterium]|nr:RNA methyltransferase [Polyangiaceae bacterium]
MLWPWTREQGQWTGNGLAFMVARMRRVDIETIHVSLWGDRLAQRIGLGQVDAEFVIRVLEPFATERRREKLQRVFADRIGSVTVVMDSICDPHNGAALLRTCEAFGVARIHLLEQGASFLAHAGVARGTHKWVEVRTHADAESCVKALRDDGMVLVGAHPQGKLQAEDLQSIPRLALVLGNEHQGIRPVLTQACEHAVRVPMRGFAESLNVSVSGGILLAYATAHRPGDLPETERRRLYARGLAVTVPNAGALLERADHERFAGEQDNARQGPFT